MNPNAYALMMLNGELSDAALVPYMDALVRAGYGGVCPHPREGMLVPYLSTEFWERIERIMELARERNLKLWFYDEFPYPSGAGGGIVTGLYPETRVRGLEFLELCPPPGNELLFLTESPVLAVLRMRRRDDGGLSDLRDVTSDCGPHSDTWGWNEWHNRFYTGALCVREEQHERGFAQRGGWAYKPRQPLEEGELLLVISLKESGGKPGWHGMPDVSRAEVTDIFLDRIYRPYAELARRHNLGPVPIFQDEVTFFAANPWNAEIERRWRQVWGSGWAVQLAALHSFQAPGWENARWQYRAICEDCLEENWYRRVSAFCRENGLQMAGHLPGEESVLGHTSLLGNIFRNLRHFDIPGYDLISSHTADDENRCQALGAKLVQSAAWLENRSSVMVEVFGAHGHHLDWRQARTELAWLAAHDMTEVMDHSAYMSAVGTRKYEAPPLNNRFNPQFEAYADLWSWHAWFMEQMAGYRFQPETLVHFPVESLARFQFSETEHWRGQVELLESFFHFLCAHSLDCIFVPTERLDEISLVAEGFELNGHTYSQFVVPPVASFHSATVGKLRRLAAQEGFVHFVPEGDTPTVFCVTGEAHGSQPNRGEAQPRANLLGAHRLKHCSRQMLDDHKSAFFAGILNSAVEDVRAPHSIIKSLRHNAEGEQLLVLINPNQHEVTVQLGTHTGWALPQPPHGYTPEPLEPLSSATPASRVVHLPGRDVLVLRKSADQESGETATEVSSRGVTALGPERVLVSSSAPNAYSLKAGAVSLSGHSEVPFRPWAISRLWRLADVPYQADEVLGPYFSRAKLPDPVAFQAHFPLRLEHGLDELQLVLDAESTPPGTQIHWDGVPLKMETANVFSQGNTIYPVPAPLLAAGEHRLTLHATVTEAWQGLLERPILRGHFTVQQQTPLVLTAVPAALQPWDGTVGWDTLGLPEGFGPVLYQGHYELPEESIADGNAWCLTLPGLRGTAVVRVNGELAGRASWGSLPLPSGALRAGANIIEVELTATWNNLFSTLNRHENGLSAYPQLVATAPCR